MGAQINGIGSDKLVIEGVERLHGATYRVMPDRIEAGSYACAAAITGGSLELVGANAADMHAILAGLREAGVTVEERPDCIKVSANGRSEEHTSELQSLMRISYAVFCLKKKKNKTQTT